MRKREVLRWGLPGADCAGYFDARVCVRACVCRKKREQQNKVKDEKMWENKVER